MTTDNEEYDPKTCVTAKELRSYGVQIPLAIPDPAWVPKKHVRYDVKASVSTVDEEKQRINYVTPVHIDVEFKWISVEVKETADEMVVTRGEHRAKVSAE